MRIGVLAPLQSEGNSFDRVRKFGLSSCQLVNWDMKLWNDSLADRVRKESAETGVIVSALWAGWSGPKEWNFTEGPLTLGLVPQKYRKQRVKDLKHAADFAKRAGLPAIITHAGFLPENLTDRDYKPVLRAIVDIGSHCRSLGIGFWFETGQETPVTLLRYIEESGLDNLGVNLDPANLILYGKGSPVDSLDVFGKYVKDLHAKDGLYPVNGRELGREVAIGEGKVNFPLLIKKLKEIGYSGELTIEREISGEEQDKDIRKAIADLGQWLKD